MHLYGDEAAVEFLLELDVRLSAMSWRNEQVTGNPLRFALFSDHGCGSCRIRHANGFDDLLRASGFRVIEHLEGPTDVVDPNYGVINFGTLYLQDSERAEAAANAVAQQENTEIAAFSLEPDSVDVVSRSGRARVRWRDSDGVRYAYEDGGGDPLRLAAVRDELVARKLIDDSGFAADDEWLRATASEYYPDALHRLATALTGDRVQSRANVIYSLDPSLGPRHLVGDRRLVGPPWPAQRHARRSRPRLDACVLPRQRSRARDAASRALRRSTSSVRIRRATVTRRRSCDRTARTKPLRHATQMPALCLELVAVAYVLVVSDARQRAPERPNSTDPKFLGPPRAVDGFRHLRRPTQSLPSHQRRGWRDRRGVSSTGYAAISRRMYLIDVSGTSAASSRAGDALRTSLNGTSQMRALRSTFIVVVR